MCLETHGVPMSAKPEPTGKTINTIEIDAKRSRIDVLTPGSRCVYEHHKEYLCGCPKATWINNEHFDSAECSPNIAK